MDLVSPAQPNTAPSGFPSPAQDYFHGGIDLNKHLIRDRTCTFVMRVSGDSMAGAGIADGDEIIVDRSLTPRDGSVVVVIVEDELLIRRLVMHDGAPSLATHPADAPSPTAAAVQAGELAVWGVVTRCLHHV
ncbi:translesion error-prone DNA polymerase V autoproteolytic subunit [Arthrobacter sp. H35-D1]|uniref:LexA family protein n=1 Tax=Arthrobacter sp. H35-D1 TaxID=3046202 RepID=UPI0024BA128C|nr:translesion error-prone DNA polymerase V autoproteolytic subunit [Arthrobacter sp. H35-D1]MDJ0314165.1 translesion error-prone DNA polymerase V autoproteolytic subunit [Arthrobacter sp. H35-D1]